MSPGETEKGHRLQEFDERCAVDRTGGFDIDASRSERRSAISVEPKAPSW